MEQGGFSLGKWQSNPPELIDNEEGEAIKAIADNAKPFGVSWDSNNDNFVFQFDKEKVEKAVETPHQHVSVQASTSSSPGWDSKLKPVVKESGHCQSSNCANLPSHYASLPWGQWIRPSLSFISFATHLQQDLAPLASEWKH